MPTSTHNYTIKTSSNEITFYIQKLEHAKLSNFHFGSVFIGATDQRENAKQNRISSNNIKGLSRKRLYQNRAGVPQICTGTCPRCVRRRAPEVHWNVPQITTRSCP